VEGIVRTAEIFAQEWHGLACKHGLAKYHDVRPYESCPYHEQHVKTAANFIHRLAMRGVHLPADVGNDPPPTIPMFGDPQ
jgi:hypothetical protein